MRYLVVVSLHDMSAQRLQTFVPAFQTTLAKLSKDKPEQAFRSFNADLFGYVINSDKEPRQIVAMIETPARSTRDFEPPTLEGQDNMMILEIGEKFSCGAGFTRLGTWLQHHH